MPEGWAWASLSEIANLYTGNSINENEKTNKYSNLKEGLFYIATKDIDFDGKIDYDNGIRIPSSETKFKIAPAESTLLCIEGGSAGRKIGFINQSVCFVNKLCCFHSDSLSNLYLFYYLQSKTFKDLFNSNKNGLIGGVSLNLLKSIFIPVAPIIEQDIISETIKTYLEKISFLDNDKETLEVTIKKAKAKILDLAIHGKLVPQDANDEPASVLLEKLRAEKEEKIAKGEIKRDKNDSYIYKGSDNCYYEKFKDGTIVEIDIPFEIPDTWCWCRLREIVYDLGDGIHGTPKYDDKGQYYFINGNNLLNGKIEIKQSTKRVSEIEYKKYKKNLSERTIFVSINGTLGNIAFYNNEPIILGKSACYFNLTELISKDYVYNFLNTNYFKKYAVENATGSTIKNVSLQSMRNLYIPIPPEKEQERILNIINKTYSELNQIQNNVI